MLILMLVILHFLVYVSFSIWSISGDIRDRAEPHWSIAAEIYSVGGLLLCALSYWIPFIHYNVGKWSIVVFASALSISFAQTIRSFHRCVVLDADLNRYEKIRTFASGISIIIITEAPMVYWGFMSAILGTYRQT